MTMMEDVTVPEPGGFLAEMQRARCSGVSAMSTYQGMLVDEIVLPQSAAEAKDPAQLVLAATGYAEAMQRQGLYLPGEFAQEALWSFYAHDYTAQAAHGGHALYFDQRGGDDIALKCASAGLKSMVADPHYEIFTSMMRVKTGHRRAVRKFLAQRKYRNVEAAMRDLDKRLIALEAQEPLMPRHKMWLKSLRKVKLIPDAEMGMSLQRIAASNPMRARRQEEYARVQAEREKDDPTYRAVKALCEMAGLRFVGLGQRAAGPMREVWPEGPDQRALIWRVDTDRGPRFALFYSEGAFFKRRLSVLMEQGGALPLGSLTLARGEYEAIVPAAARR